MSRWCCAPPAPRIQARAGCCKIIEVKPWEMLGLYRRLHLVPVHEVPFNPSVRRAASRHPVTAFFLPAYVIAWAWWVPLISK